MFPEVPVFGMQEVEGGSLFDDIMEKLCEEALRNRTIKGLPFVEYNTYTTEVYHGRNDEEKKE